MESQFCRARGKAGCRAHPTQGPKRLANHLPLQRRAISLPEAEPNSKGLNTPLQTREKVEGLSGRARACNIR